MPDKDQLNNDTDRDVRPSQGQESNENWDDTAEQQPDTNVLHKEGMSTRVIDEQTNTSGYGSSQRVEHGNVGPLDSDFAELPSQKRAGRTSATDQGI